MNLPASLRLHLDKWVLTFLSGLFLFVVLYVYKGYNIDQIPSLTGHSLLFRAITHGIITSLFFYTAEFHIRRYFPIITIKELLIWHGLELLIGLNLAFLTFNYFWQWTEMQWSSYLQFFYEYPMVIIFPIIISRLVAMAIRNERDEDSFIVLTSENRKNNFRIRSEHLLYLRSTDNYVEIFYRSNGTIKTHLLRKSLKEIDEEHASSPHLIRCHRSYMVNPENIDHVTRQSKSTILAISGTQIPVSDKYAERFRIDPS